MITSETALLDTNVLVYAADRSSPFHAASAALRDRGLRDEVSLCLTPQVLLEFFAVITSPKRVTQAIEPREAMAEVEKYVQADTLDKIYPGPDLLDRLRQLFRVYEVRRQEIFDLQLVATMLSNGVRRIYTYNRDPFTRFSELEVLSP